MMKRLVVGVLGVVVLVAAGCASVESDSMMGKKSLYDRLGGKPAITAVVDDFIGNVAGDNARITRLSGQVPPEFFTAALMRSTISCWETISLLGR